MGIFFRSAAILTLLGVLAWPAAAQKGGDFGGGPGVGQAAPDFKLKSLADPKKEVQLSSFKGKKPVVLIFGSYT